MPKSRHSDSIRDTERIWAYIIGYVQVHRSSPTYQEIATYIRTSPSNARRHVRILEEAGYLEREPRAHRGLTLLTVKPYEYTKEHKSGP